MSICYVMIHEPHLSHTYSNSISVGKYSNRAISSIKFATLRDKLSLTSSLLAVFSFPLRFKQLPGINKPIRLVASYYMFNRYQVIRNFIWKPVLDNKNTKQVLDHVDIKL